jgi:hypothetical protein
LGSLIRVGDQGVQSGIPKARATSSGSLSKSPGDLDPTGPGTLDPGPRCGRCRHQHRDRTAVAGDHDLLAGLDPLN